MTIYPRKHSKGVRGNDEWAADMDNPIVARVGITADRSSRAEIRGVAEIEFYNMRYPASIEGVGPGAIVEWRGALWDAANPPFLRATRTHSVRHYTVQIRRRPYNAVGVRK